MTRKDKCEGGNIHDACGVHAEGLPDMNGCRLRPLVMRS
jgi:hypothetical protein